MDAPTSVVLVGRTATVITILWSPVIGPPVPDGYKIYYNGVYQSTVTGQYNTVTTITGLSPDSSILTFSVIAYDGESESSHTYGDPAGKRTYAALPTGMSVDSPGSYAEYGMTLVISWNDNGNPLDTVRYIVGSTEDGIYYPAFDHRTGSPSIYNIIAEQSYNFYLIAVNSNGEESAKVFADAIDIKQLTDTSAPEDLVVANKGEDYININFNLPGGGPPAESENPGGSARTYTVYLDSVENGVIIPSGGSPLQTYAITGLTQGTEYTICVEAESSGEPIISNFVHKRIITIDHTKVEGNLTDFPAAIHVTGLDTDHLRSDGQDIVFYLEDDETKLPMEIDNYDNVTGELWVYVKVLGTLSSSEDTVLHMYYNCPDYTQPAADEAYGSQAVWDDNFVFVSHMKDDPDNTHIKDSTSYGNDGVEQAGSNIVEHPGLLYKNQVFQTGSLINIGNDSSLALTELSISLEVHFTSPCELVHKHGTEYSFIIDGGGNLKFFGKDSVGEDISLVSTASGFTPAHVAVAYSTTVKKLYINGADDTNVNDAGNGIIATGAYPLYLGWGLVGQLEEIRMSKIARSEAWFSTENQNIRDVDNFHSVDVETDENITEYEYLDRSVVTSQACIDATTEVEFHDKETDSITLGPTVSEGVGRRAPWARKVGYSYELLYEKLLLRASERTLAEVRSDPGYATVMHMGLAFGTTITFGSLDVQLRSDDDRASGSPLDTPEAGVDDSDIRVHDADIQMRGN